MDRQQRRRRLPERSNPVGRPDFDGYGDNPVGFEPDACTATAGNSTGDRFGCLDTDGDGYSNPDGTWTTANGADACDGVSGTSSQDRNGCADQDGDGYSDPDGSWGASNGADAYPTDDTQWADSDGDGYGDNPPPATAGDKLSFGERCLDQDRFGCTDSDGDGYSDPDSVWTVANGADAFASDSTQWADADSDGYGDNAEWKQPRRLSIAVWNLDGNGTIGVRRFGRRRLRRCSTMPSPTNPRNGSTPTATATAMKPQVSKAMRVQQRRAVRPETGWLHRQRQRRVLGRRRKLDASNGADIAPNDNTQWVDSDGDGYGDNPSGTNGDQSFAVAGNSTQDRRGCTDTDGDGYSDPDAGHTVDDGADAFPNDPNRWGDRDGDGYDDGLDDDCPLLLRHVRSRPKGMSGSRR